MRTRYMILFSILILLLSTFCFGEFSPASHDRFIVMATTTGVIDSGIIDALKDAFERETGIRVRHIGAKRAATLDIARKGNVDLVMVYQDPLKGSL